LSHGAWRRRRMCCRAAPLPGKTSLSVAGMITLRREGPVDDRRTVLISQVAGLAHVQGQAVFSHGHACGERCSQAERLLRYDIHVSST